MEQDYSPSNKAKKVLAWAAAAVATVGVASEVLSGWAIVGGNEAACFHRTLSQTYDCGGKTTYQLDGQEVTGPKYYGPGFKLKMPWISKMDPFQITKNDLGEQTVNVNIGSENQQATINYKAIIEMPREGMLSAAGKYVSGGEYVNYKIGSFGSSDAVDLVKSRINADVQAAFAPIDPGQLSTGRQGMSNNIKTTVEKELSEIGVKVDYFQVTNAHMNDAWERAAAVRIQAKAQKEAAIDQGDAEITRADKHATALGKMQGADTAYARAMTDAYGGNGMAAALASAWDKGNGPIALGSGIIVDGGLARQRLVAGAKAPDNTAPAAK